MAAFGCHLPSSVHKASDDVAVNIAVASDLVGQDQGHIPGVHKPQPVIPVVDQNVRGDIRFLERGIGLALDDGEFEKALALCDQAIALGLGKVYAAKRTSVERMM